MSTTRTFILQKDGVHVASTFLEFCPTPHIHHEVFVRSVIDAYEAFLDRLVHALERAFPREDNVAVEVIDAEAMAVELLAQARQHNSISLNPLVDLGERSLGISRLYTAGGMIPISEVARPGYAPLKEQFARVKELAGGEPVTLIEDDCFSGGTLKRVIRRLKGLNVAVDKIIVGLDALTPQGRAQFEALGVPDITSLYHVDKDQVLDLSDVRDFILGAEGLVVGLPNGEIGRIPYFSPFASASARISIPGSAERAFSTAMLAANIEFYGALAAVGIRPLVGEIQSGTSEFLMAWLDCDENESVFGATAQLAEVAAATQFFPRGGAVLAATAQVEQVRAFG